METNKLDLPKVYSSLQLAMSSQNTNNHFEAYAQTFDGFRRAVSRCRAQNDQETRGMPTDNELAKYFETVFFKSMNVNQKGGTISDS